MSPKTKTFLNEKKIYVSWGLLMIAIWLAYATGQTMKSIEEQIKPIPTIVIEVQDLRNVTKQIEQISAIIPKFQDLQLGFVDMKADLRNIKTQLHLYDIEVKN